MLRRTDDLRIQDVRPLIPPAILHEELPLSERASNVVADARLGAPARLMVDCSHGNSQREASRQPAVAADLARQTASGSGRIFGVMLESHLVAGRQDCQPGVQLVYGQSITDACIGMDQTEAILRELAEAVRHRRDTAR